jgi:hypothetical protein
VETEIARRVVPAHGDGGDEREGLGDFGARASGELPHRFGSVQLPRAKPSEHASIGGRRETRDERARGRSARRPAKAGGARLDSPKEVVV